MSFLMTHLIVAKNLNETFAEHIYSLPQYYLGSTAPDAVHNRANYISDFKKTSHLVPGPQRWGMTKDNDKWKESIVKFCDEHRGSDNHDFILGYCIHLLTDMYNNVKAWIPFITKHPEEFDRFDKGLETTSHQDCKRIDHELALTYEGKDELWQHLKKSNSVELPDIILADEVEKQKDLILNEWYKDAKHQDLSLNKIRTYEFEINFINEAVDFITQSLSAIDLGNDGMKKKLLIAGR